MIEVLASRNWLIHWGGLLHPQGGIEGRLTKCRLGRNVFYVRENVVLPGHGFNITAGERQAIKCGRLAKRHQQVLELAAPDHCWEELAQVVARADGLQRPVRRHRQFTAKWAESELGTP